MSKRGNASKHIKAIRKQITIEMARIKSNRKPLLTRVMQTVIVHAVDSPTENVRVTLLHPDGTKSLVSYNGGAYDLAELGVIGNDGNGGPIGAVREDDNFDDGYSSDADTWTLP